jgi:hypothetical protein
VIKDGFKNVLYRFLKEIASKRKDKEIATKSCPYFTAGSFISAHSI